MRLFLFASFLCSFAFAETQMPRVVCVENSEIVSMQGFKEEWRPTGKSNRGEQNGCRIVYNPQRYEELLKLKSKSVMATASHAIVVKNRWEISFDQQIMTADSQEDFENKVIDRLINSGKLDALIESKL